MFTGTNEQIKVKLYPYMQDTYFMEREFINLFDTYYEEIRKFNVPPEFLEKFYSYLTLNKEMLVLFENRLHYYELPLVTKPVTNTLFPTMINFFTTLKPTTFVEYVTILYTFEHFKISLYRELTVLARVFGDKDTLFVAEKFLYENIEFQRWFFEHIPEATLFTLEYEKVPVPRTVWEFAKELELVSITSPYTIPTN